MVVSLLIDAIVLSSTFALLSFGFTLQFITIGTINLAQPNIVIFTSYFALLFCMVGYSPYLSIPVASLVGGILTLSIWKILSYMKKRGSDSNTLLITTLAISLIIYGSTNVFADYISQTMGTRRIFGLSIYDFSFLGMPGILFFSLISSILFALIFHLFLKKCKTGIAIKAILEDQSLAEIHGVNTELLLNATWFITGCLSGLAGVFYSMWFFVQPVVWILFFVRMISACIIGGATKPFGSFFGAFIVGFSEVLFIIVSSNIIGPGMAAYRSIVPVALVCIILFAAPKGIIEAIEKYRRK
jgi:branched-chain amino acid transport system permease protein